MRRSLVNFCLIPLMSVPSFRACDALQDMQATASAAAECAVVEGGGDLMSGDDLTALSHLAPGNSGAALSARFGLPSSYCGDRVFYPVLTTDDPLWVWIDINSTGMQAWGYQTLPPPGA